MWPFIYGIIFLAISLLLSISYIAYKIIKKQTQRGHYEVPDGGNDIEMVEMPHIFEPEVPRPGGDGFVEVELHAVDTSQPLVNRNYQEFQSTLEEDQNLVQIVGEGESLC